MVFGVICSRVAIKRLAFRGITFGDAIARNVLSEPEVRSTYYPSGTHQQAAVLSDGSVSNGHSTLVWETLSGCVV